jgi:hypothetical protein
LARPIVLIPHLFRFADAINFRKDYSPPPSSPPSRPFTCVKWFELGISNTCDEGVCGKEWWPQDHKEMVHGHEMTIMVEMHMK